MTKYRAGDHAAQLARLIDRTPFTTAAGLPGNQKIEMDRLPRSSSLYMYFVENVGLWAAEQAVEVITAVPNGANRFARDVARHNSLPLAVLKKRSDRFRWDEPASKGLDLLRQGANVGVVEDVRSTGYSAARVARKIPHVVGAYALVDRGEDVAGVRTLEEATTYAKAHPYAPPAHIAVHFPYDSLLKVPLGLLAENRDICL